MAMDSNSENVNLAEIVRSTADELKAELKAEFRDTIANLTSMIDQLKQSIDLKNDHISDLEQRITKVVQQNVKLSSEVSVMQRHIEDVVEVRIDDLEQYSRKNCLRIEGIKHDRAETNESLTTKVVDELNRYGAKISKDDIFRLHRIGRERTRLNGKRIARQTIVRFRNWGARSRAFSTKFCGTDDERKLRPAFVLLDLTRRRLTLLKRARAALDKHNVAHAYADGECRLLIKKTD